MGKGDWKELPVSKANVNKTYSMLCSRLRRRVVLHSLPTPDSELLLDNAVQPAADDSSDAEDSEFEW